MASSLQKGPLENLSKAAEKFMRYLYLALPFINSDAHIVPLEVQSPLPISQSRTQHLIFSHLVNSTSDNSETDLLI